MNLDEWLKISQKILPFSVVSITGGEPLLAKETIPLIKNLSRKKVVVTLVTNGSLLTKKKIDELVEAKLKYLMISIDGTGSYHDESRGVTGSYQKIIDALTYIEKNHSQDLIVGIKTVVKPDNDDEIKLLIKRLEEFKCVNDINLGLLFDNLPNGALYSYEEFTHPDFQRGNTYRYPEETKTRVKNLVKYIFEIKEKSRIGLSFTIKTINDKDLLNFVDSPRSFGVPSCTIPWTDYSIHSNGDITPCLSYKLGNMKNLEYNVRKIPNLTRTKMFQRFMRKNKNLPACEGCTYAPPHRLKAECQ